MMIPGLAGLDPSKLKPEVLMKLTQLVRDLPHEHIMAMQGLMQRAMTGQDVSVEMQSLEQKFPAGFREKLAKLMYEVHEVDVTPVKQPESIKEARLMILDGVANGAMSTEQAYKVLFEEP